MNNHYKYFATLDKAAGMLASVATCLECPASKTANCRDCEKTWREWLAQEVPEPQPMRSKRARKLEGKIHRVEEKPIIKTTPRCTVPQCPDKYNKEACYYSTPNNCPIYRAVIVKGLRIEE